MEVIYCKEEKGEFIHEPFKREIKIFLAPDEKNVEEINYIHALIYPGNGTDMHAHDRPELITIIEGEGYAVYGDKKVELKKDMALWVKANEIHQIINTGDTILKLANVFVPGYSKHELLGEIKVRAERNTPT